MLARNSNLFFKAERLYTEAFDLSAIFFAPSHQIVPTVLLTAPAFVTRSQPQTRGLSVQRQGTGARAIFAGELDSAYMAARQIDGGDGIVEHLLLGLFELVL
jgi:hypothetical protein